MPSREIIEFLERTGTEYQRIEHPEAFTALEVAESAHISGRVLAKTVVLEIDDELALMVLPASMKVDLEQLRQSIRADTVEMADARRFCHRFGGCEEGAIPPLGNLYDLEVYIAEPLTQQPEITFCAGSHHELIQIHYQAFAKLVKPVVVRYGLTGIGPTPARMKEHTGLHY